MSNTINDSADPMAETAVAVDFLPSPADLVFREDTVKVTMALSRVSIEFFKEQGKKYDMPYQRLIRRLLDEYARTFANQ